MAGLENMTPHSMESGMFQNSSFKPFTDMIYSNHNVTNVTVELPTNITIPKPPFNWNSFYHKGVLQIAVSTPLFCLCIILNVLVIVAIRRMSGSTSFMHRLMINLAIGDILGAGYQWLWALKIATIHITKSRWVCFHNAAVLFRVVSYSVCSLTLFFVAYFRYLAICHPMSNLKRSVTSRTVILVIWGLSFLLCFPLLLVHFIIDPKDPNCVLGNKAPKLLQISIIYYQIWSGIIMVLIVSVVLIYLRVFIEAQVLRPHIGNSASSRRDTKDNYNALTTTLLLTATLAFATLPHFIYTFILNHDTEIVLGLPPFVTDLVDFLPFFNFLSDPIIYGFRTKQVRQQCKRILRCKMDERGSNTDSTTSVTYMSTYKGNSAGKYSMKVRNPSIISSDISGPAGGRNVNESAVVTKI